MNTIHLKFIFKNLKKSGKITVFNLIGLSVSFAAFMLISIYVFNEFTYDRFNKDYERIYRLNMVKESNGQKQVSTRLPNPLADDIRDNLSEFESQCSFAWGPMLYVKESDQLAHYEIATRAVDSTFTDIFTLRIKSGNQHPLRTKNSIIISEKTAIKVFGDENPVGKTLLANYTEPYIIEAIFYDLPENSSFKYDAFCSYPTTEWIDYWSEYSFIHFFKFLSNADMSLINSKIQDITSVKNLINDYPDAKISFTFTPLKDYHFDSQGGGGNLVFAKTLVFVAILVLLMAFINYLNFAIANAPKLIRSVNMRRIVGESKRSLMVMLSLESVILMTISFVLATFLCFLTINYWPDIFGYQIDLKQYIPLLLTCWLLFVLLGIVFSFYPSRIIVGVQPALALKGMIRFSAKRSYSGKILTVIQYSISILLILSVLFIEKQISFLKNYDLGFDKENIVVLETTPTIQSQKAAFIDEIMRNPNIIDYAFSQFVPGGVGMSWGREIDGKQVNFYCWPVDERYLSFMGFEVIEGNTFSSNIEADENNFIFNQKALEEFNWTEGYLGKNIPGFDFTGKLIGVVKNMKYARLHEEVQPMAFWLTQQQQRSMSLKIRGENTGATLNHIKEVYERFESKYPFDLSFLDEQLDAQYKQEEKQAQLIFVFCLISIIISIIGALGVIIFMCEYRVKEIGIRKINGAKVSEIVAMLNMNFVKLVFIAFCIAAPISYFVLDRWLQNFAYRTNLSWWIFLLAGIVTLAVVVFTVSWYSWRAARKNPVDSLRYE
ncbi:MAG: FtsX-like permease family protein [Bacteroidales bacterium]|jgi:putative ABC transport system permease protein|nr:FtsX-like permease family protein [Bacteroidales bacterium]